MGKPFRINKFLFLAMIIFLLAGLQYISGDKHLSSCSPFRNTFLEKSMARKLLAASFETQETTAAAAMERAEIAPAKRPTTHPEVPRIAALEVKQLISKKADIVIIDTQPAENYEMWHIPRAVNVPYVSTGNPTDREMMLVALPLDKLIVIYCLCEEGTDSARMALELRRLGYDDDKIKVLEGGLIKWDEWGYPMIKQGIPQ